MVELGLGGGRGHVEVMFLLSVAVVVSPVRVRGFHVFHVLLYIYIIISITNRVPSDDLYLSSLRYHTITE